MLLSLLLLLLFVLVIVVLLLFVLVLFVLLLLFGVLLFLLLLFVLYLLLFLLMDILSNLENREIHVEVKISCFIYFICICIKYVFENYSTWSRNKMFLNFWRDLYVNVNKEKHMCRYIFYRFLDLQIHSAMKMTKNISFSKFFNYKLMFDTIY